jgi:catechol 2,3-dioxygenase-like lactoylglutathione lyase family enzyme
MRFINPIVFASDLAASTLFYRDVIGLSVQTLEDMIVIFDGGFAIHDAASLTRTIWGPSATPEEGLQGRRNLLLYFEDDAVEAMFARVKDRVELIHPIEKQSWGQRVFRLYDPDRYAIEIGEPMSGVPSP